MTDFALAHAAGTDARAIAEDCASQLGARGHTVGFVYATARLEGSLAAIVDHLALATGVVDWVGTVGHGVCATGVDYYDTPAVVALTAGLPEGSYRLFATADEARRASLASDGIAIVHGDPRNGTIIESVAGLSHERGAFLVGGLTASRGAYPQVVGARLVDGGLSGMLLGGGLEVAVGLTQGCTPVGPMHQVTGADENVIAALDAQRAYDVLCEDVGIAEGADPRPWLVNVHAALPVARTDTADYMVRNLVGIDPEQGLVAIADAVSAGDRMMFVRRDAASAVKDLDRMLADLAARVARPPKAGLYFSCVARGPDLFEAPAHEMKAIQKAFGDIPVVGFLGNGEISNDRVYGYTGVLTLFS